MSNITIIGSGMMGSAMARPASDNGHQVRLVGSPLDDHIIAALKAGKDHPTLKRSFAGVATPYYITELQEALKGTAYPGFKLVEGKSNRKFTDENAVAKIVTEAGYEVKGIA